MAKAITRSHRWLWVALVALSPLAALNLTVAICGSSAVFPLSPFFLKQKAHALAAYAHHRAGCLGQGHDVLDLDAWIAQTERRHKLPRHLLAALVTIESNNQVHRISPTGAMGPAQLMPGTAADLHVLDPFDPQTNVDAGGRYLSRLMKRYHQWPLAIAAYNAGPGNVKDRVPDIRETQAYVRRVLAAWQERKAAAQSRIASR
ncbi:MAG: lytic transglycosylase domain-containing protein [Deltaproteobacteria bacterium]|nr:lytic transglycosylase domain-containing protein [Deltaproteobacteria bacterium]